MTSYAMAHLKLDMLLTETCQNGVDSVGAKQGSSALPDFDLHSNEGKAGETFALAHYQKIIAALLETERIMGEIERS